MFTEALFIISQKVKNNPNVQTVAALDKFRNLQTIWFDYMLGRKLEMLAEATSRTVS